MILTESKIHRDLVNLIVIYIKKNHSNLDPNLFYIDNGDPNASPPQMGDGYRPDFFYEWDHQLIIGEAKTPFDLERQHSVFQYHSFINQCENFEGNAQFILSTNWYCEAAAKNLLSKIRRDAKIHKTKINVISEMGFIEEDKCKK